MTIFEAISTKVKMPKMVYNYNVIGPTGSMDDPLEVRVWFRVKRESKTRHFVIRVKEFEVIEEGDKEK